MGRTIEDLLVGHLELLLLVPQTRGEAFQLGVLLHSLLDIYAQAAVELRSLNEQVSASPQRMKVKLRSPQVPVRACVVLLRAT
jgi:hypothetical protein